MNIDQLSMGELAAIEKATGQPISNLGDDSKPQMALLIEAAFLLHKRIDPSYTHGQAEAMTMAELGALMTPAEDEPDFPTQTSA